MHNQGMRSTRSVLLLHRLHHQSLSLWQDYRGARKRRASEILAAKSFGVNVYSVKFREWVEKLDWGTAGPWEGGALFLMRKVVTWPEGRTLMLHHHAAIICRAKRNNLKGSKYFDRKRLKARP